MRGPNEARTSAKTLVKQQAFVSAAEKERYQRTFSNAEQLSVSN